MDGIDEETKVVPEEEDMNGEEDFELLFGSKRPEEKEEEKEEEKKLSRIV